MRRLRVPGYGFQLTQGLLDSGAIVLVLFLVLLRSASAQPTLAHTVIPDNYESMEMLGIIDELR
jgi:hypothetical protein